MARDHEVWTGMVDDLDEHHMARDHEVWTGMVDDLDEHHTAGAIIYSPHITAHTLLLLGAAPYSCAHHGCNPLVGDW